MKKHLGLILYRGIPEEIKISLEPYIAYHKDLPIVFGSLLNDDGYFLELNLEHREKKNHVWHVYIPKHHVAMIAQAESDDKNSIGFLASFSEKMG